MAARILGLWLLYATVGVVLVVMLLAGGGDMGSGDSNSPTRTRTKVVGAASGAAFIAVALGAYLLGDPSARRDAAWLLVAGGLSLAVPLTIWAWVWIARDLRRGRRR